MFSLVIPVYNEEQNIDALYHRLIDVLQNTFEGFEIIFIDDGSTDKSFELLRNLKEKDGRVKVIKFKRNFGQHAALLAGFLTSGGETIISLDADLRNEPGDIPAFLEKMDEGYDVVKGWRIQRDAAVARKFYSIFSNKTFGFFLHEEIHDYGCALGAFRRNLFSDIKERGNSSLIKYIHLYCLKKAKKVGEIKIKDTSKNSKSKYNFLMLAKLYLCIMKELCCPSHDKSPDEFYDIEQIL